MPKSRLTKFGRDALCAGEESLICGSLQCKYSPELCALGVADHAVGGRIPLWAAFRQSDTLVTSLNSDVTPHYAMIEIEKERHVVRSELKE